MLGGKIYPKQFICCINRKKYFEIALIILGELFVALVTVTICNFFTTESIAYHNSPLFSVLLFVYAQNGGNDK